MQYYSTNHQSNSVSFRDAILHGDAPDGGLYMPERLPLIPNAFLKNISEMQLRDIAYILGCRLFDGDLPASVIKNIADQAVSFPIPLKEIEPGIFALELFHGPTLTVKDISSLFMIRILRELHADTSAPINLMLATTGNSGSAVANSFQNMQGINVFVLYPRGVPDRFLTHLNSFSDNVHPICVSGTIDDCRKMIANAFTDQDMRSSLQITSANSFNIGNLLTYTTIYFHAFAQLCAQVSKPKDIQIAVPCGNCGNLLAGYMAIKMGLPVNRLIAACNANASFHNFLNEEQQETKSVVHTYAYAMDSKVTDNHKRFLELCDGDLGALRQQITSSVCSDQMIADTIMDVYQRTGYVLDPHSATAYRALKDNLMPGASGIFMATAHPSRSSELMAKITNRHFELPTKNMRFIKKPARPESIAPTLPALKKFLKYSGVSGAQEFRV